VIIMADATRINQILINLATNAGDAMLHGGTLAIETKLVHLDSGYTRDIVLDKGIGEKKFDFIAKPLSPYGFY
jgi:C4-dicarboxylate-specific signal transduction histidine kinase